MNRLQKLQCVPVYTTASETNGHYTLFCKQILWPMFHYIIPNFEKGYKYGLATLFFFSFFFLCQIFSFF